MAASSEFEAGAVRAPESGEIAALRDPALIRAAAEAEAQTKAFYLAAHRWPRDYDVAREKILRDARRPTSAEIALYHKPVGRKLDQETREWRQQFATNFSIRGIESALQRWTNVHSFARLLYEDARAAHLQVATIDFETNTGYSLDQSVEKTVERRDGKGRLVRGQRINSQGDPVYIVDATEEEFKIKLGAERSKMIRDNGQRLLPREIMDEAKTLIEKTVLDETAKDPDSAKKKILDRFAGLGVGAQALKEYLDRPLESLNAKDLMELANLYNGLKEGSVTWAEVMRAKREADEEAAPQASAGSPSKTKLSDVLREKQAEFAAERKKPPQPAAPAQAEPEKKPPESEEQW